MTTAASRALVALLTIPLLVGCASTIHSADPSAGVRPRLESLQFDNQGRDRVDIYLVGETQSWRLGRLEPGQARWLPLPRSLPVRDLGRLQLVVLANSPPSVAPLRDPRAVTTLRQSVGALTNQRWSFAAGQLRSLGEGARGLR